MEGPTAEKRGAEGAGVEGPRVRVEELKMDGPRVEEPNVEEPNVAEPGVKEPSVKEPSVKEPNVEEPNVEEPNVEEPRVEKARVEEPNVEEPRTEEAGVEGPTAEAALCKFFSRGHCRFGTRCRSLHHGTGGRGSPPRPVVEGKLPAMRTAWDVVSRVRWDETLDAAEWSVVYVDRFLGELERPFLDFWWGGLAGAPHGELAVPQHRVRRLRWRGECVWDRERRLDRVFGSTGDAVVFGDPPAPRPGAAAGEQGAVWDQGAAAGDQEAVWDQGAAGQHLEGSDERAQRDAAGPERASCKDEAGVEGSILEGTGLVYAAALGGANVKCEAGPKGARPEPEGARPRDEAGAKGAELDEVGSEGAWSGDWAFTTNEAAAEGARSSEWAWPKDEPTTSKGALSGDWALAKDGAEPDIGQGPVMGQEQRLGKPQRLGRSRGGMA
ncbi:leukocyte receptor cluster member 9 [Petromyzon marinus]|uniref:leukocyte receptor cluster member 9 n=1 Tax=Petromyzon marinus TaxID=7757 RepID=UPI003F722996